MPVVSSERRQKFRASLVWAAIIVGIFYGIWILALVVNTAVWAAFGHTQRVMGPLMSVVFLLSPFAATWLSVRLLKGRVPLQGAYPENGVGGMTLGLAMVAWFSMSALGGRSGRMMLLSPLVAIASFVIAATLLH
jgi:hypothetical protein